MVVDEDILLQYPVEACLHCNSLLNTILTHWGPSGSVLGAKSGHARDTFKQLKALLPTCSSCVSSTCNAQQLEIGHQKFVYNTSNTSASDVL